MEGRPNSGHQRVKPRVITAGRLTQIDRAFLGRPQSCGLPFFFGISAVNVMIASESPAAEPIAVATKPAVRRAPPRKAPSKSATKPSAAKTTAVKRAETFADIAPKDNSGRGLPAAFGDIAPWGAHEPGADNAPPPSFGPASEPPELLPEGETQVVEGASESQATAEGGQATATAKTEPEIPADLLEMASLEGLTQGEDFSTSEDLQRTLRLLDRQRLSLGNQLLNGSANGHQQAAVQPVQQPQFVPQAPAQQPAVTDEKITQALKSIETLSPELAEPMKLLLQSSQQQVQQARAEQAAMVQRVQEQQAAAFYDSVDQAFSSLGQKFESIIGRGTRFDLAPHSQTLANRRQILQDVLALSASYERQGVQPPIAQLVKRATYGRFGDKLAAAAVAESNQNTVERVRNRQGQFIAQPTATSPRGAAERSDPVKNAENAVGAKLQKFGVPG